MQISELKEKLNESSYIYDETLATVLAVALELNRPLLIEGAAGVGKTEIAKVMAHALGRDLVRLQCYEGLDESKALYEWNYQKQLLSIQVNMGREDKDALTRGLFSDEYLLERPLLRSIRSEKPVVLLVDEIDKADEEFEAFLLELLSEMQISIPEIGTVKAASVPFVVLTSNRARPLSEALRRRCAYLYIPYPDVDKELRILKAKLPNIEDRLALSVALAVKKLRDCEEILKKPSIAETLDWAAALDALGVPELTPDALRTTAGFVLKSSEDLETAEHLFEEDPDLGYGEYYHSHGGCGHMMGDEGCRHHHGEGHVPGEACCHHHSEGHTHGDGGECCHHHGEGHTHGDGGECCHHHDRQDPAGDVTLMPHADSDHNRASIHRRIAEELAKEDLEDDLKVEEGHLHVF